MESSLIRILPACLTEPLPAGWDKTPKEFVIEVMPEVEEAAGVVMALATTEPDILLLDADAPGADVFALAGKALEAREDLAVVLVSSDSAPERLRKAMLAGAEEYLIKPLEADALRESILNIAGHRTLRVVQRNPEDVVTDDVQGLIVGVVSGKGGLGKTTLAANMATIVAKAPGKSAAMIGLDSGDGAVLLNLQPKLGLLDLAAEESEQRDETGYAIDWLRQFGIAHRSGVYYWTWQGSGTQGGADIPEDFFQSLFASCRRAYSVTFVDFPLLSPDEAQGVLPMLDVILMVSSSSDLLALRSTKTFLDNVPEEFGPRVRILINRADASDMISREDFENMLEFKIAAVLPNQPEIAAQAINMGSPFVLTQPQSDLASTLRTLAQVLFKLPVAEDAGKPKKRFMLF